jgi:protein SCO1/2
MKGKIEKLKLFVFLFGALLFSIPLAITPQVTAEGSPAQSAQKEAPQSVKPDAAQADAHATSAQATQKEELDYICPMHPEVKSKTPGSCPKCGMTLKQISTAPVAAPRPASGTRYGANYFPNVELTTQDGKKVKFYDDLMKDKIVAIDLIYTHCKDNCPLETARMVQVQKLLGDRVGKDIFFYSISIDPKNDTPEVLKAYAEKFHAGPGWLFLTGKEEDVFLIARKLGLYSTPDPSDRDGHMPTLLLGDVKTGLWMKNSALDNPSFLVRKIGELLRDWTPKVEATTSYANAPTLSFTNGQYLFATRCVACHTIGKGDLVGPDLIGVATARDRDWLRRMIARPDQMLEEKDPLATALFKKYNEVQMPNLRLADEDVNSIISYIETTSAAKLKEKAAEGTK